MPKTEKAISSTPPRLAPLARPARLADQKANRIDRTFQRLKEKRQKALIAYIMAGDPSLADTEALVLELERAGADIIELGVPFSDPIADGPIIQKAAARALRSGTSLRKILAVVATLRQQTQIPIVLMSYYNTIYAYGESALCRDAVAAGVDGLIVPDMPPEESTALHSASAKSGPSLIFLLAPTSTPARRTVVAKRSRGFIYYVPLTGITGAKLTDCQDIRGHVEKIHRLSRLPVAVGFGIKTPADAKEVASVADGVIVGSAIVRRIEEYQHDSRLAKRVGQFVHSLKSAIV